MMGEALKGLNVTEVEIEPDAGSQESLIRSFSIENLYGYKTISLASEFAATVIIAKNGSGKTTLIGAMNAFLGLQFGRLRDLKFEAIRCKLRGIEDELILYRSDLDAFFGTEMPEDLFVSARKWELEPRALMSFFLDDYASMRSEKPIDSEHPVLSAIYRAFSYRWTEALASCEKLYSLILDQNTAIARIFSTLEEALRNVELLYLPTYRRVELPLVDTDTSPARRRTKKKRFVAGHGLFTGDIQFGLADISEHLKLLNEQILFESNQGYRTISANIINELMDGTFDAFTIDEVANPSDEELQLFLSRLKDGREARFFAVHDITTPNIANLRQDPGKASNKFLIYFLSQLEKVIAVTREKEAKVQEFVDNCNKYLSLRDLSTSLHQNDSPNSEPALDSKELKLNRRNLRLHVESVPWGKKIQLDALSSGEKQMISLFAKLYLYPGEKIILVDEPELSLSIDWQRHILVDVLRSPYCRQIIAITHSPFVFDNELEPYAKSLKVKVDEQALAEMADDSDLDVDADLSE